jgi:DNA-binding protein HU-beta
LPVKASPATTVTLRHLAASLAERHDTPNKQADMILTDVFSRLVRHLKAAERVRIGGLGIIEVKNRAARMGRNPATGESIQIKAGKKGTFRPAKKLPAKKLKDAI